MKEEIKRLESIGYTFESNEHPIAGAVGRQNKKFTTVQVRYSGLIIGNRADNNPNKAMWQAVQLAQSHEQETAT